MKLSTFFDCISIDSFSSTPKYQQLAHSILKGIEAGAIEENALLPSLNELTFHLEISRETADKGYKYLQKLGVISSVPGKGHYVTSNKVKQGLKICLLINKLSVEKKFFYENFVANLPEDTSIDFYVYNNDYKLFKKLLSESNKYSHYLILPHFIGQEDEAIAMINQLPKSKLIILDKNLKGITGNYSGIYEDFEKDIYFALETALSQLTKYQSFKLIFPKNSYFPREIKNGFHAFCADFAYDREVISSLENNVLKKGEVYICLKDEDLVRLIELISDTSFVLGKDIGIISYNETPLKRYIQNGITTISTNYKTMGYLAANLVKSNKQKHIFLDFTVNLRPSL